MKNPSEAVPGAAGDFVTQGDEELFAFINALRVSVRAKVAEEQQRGSALSEIVLQVREMVRLAEVDSHGSMPFPSRVFPAILKQALAWCVETYRPALVAATDDLPACPHALDPKSPPNVRSIAKPFAEAFPPRPTPGRELQ